MPEDAVRQKAPVGEEARNTVLAALEAQEIFHRSLPPWGDPHRAASIEAVREVLTTRGHRSATLMLLRVLPTDFIEALVDELVENAAVEREALLVRRLFGRLQYQRARELVPPAVWRLLEEYDAHPEWGPVYDIWFLMAGLLDHLGLYEALRELIEKARDHIEGDVRELPDYFDPDQT